MSVLMAVPRLNWEIDEYTWQMPLGLLYVSSWLKKSGLPVETIDLNRIPQHKLQEALSKIDFSIFCTGGISAHFPQILRTIELIRSIKPEAVIVLGGGIATAEPEFIMTTIRPDFLIIGEGEIPAQMLLQSLLAKEKFVPEIPGVAFLKNGDLILHKPAPPIKNLDVLPAPDYDGFDFSGYLDCQEPFFDHNRRLFYIAGSRDCPCRCTFCFRILGGKYRVHSLEYLEKRLNAAISKYRFSEIVFLDEIIGNNQIRLEGICRIMKKIGLPWQCQLRVCDVTENLLESLADSGCTLISYGFESGSSQVLRSMKKGIRVDQIESAMCFTRQAGMTIQANFIMGDPAENLETARETFELKRRYFSFDGIGMYFIRPYPGTVLYQDLLAKGRVRDREHFYRQGMFSGLNESGKLYNMTKMTDSELKKLETLMIEENLITHVYGDVLGEEANKNDSDLSTLRVRCPICDYTEHHSVAVVLDSPPVLLTCGRCRQRFTLHRLGLMENRRNYNEYLSVVQKLKNSGCSCVVTPCLRPEFFQLFYPELLTDLKIVCFMDKEADSSLYLGNYPVLLRNPENIAKYRDFNWILLRNIDYQMRIPELIEGELLKGGVKKERILKAQGELPVENPPIPVSHRVIFSDDEHGE